MNLKLERRAVSRPLDASDEGFGGVGALYYDGTPATEARIAPDLIERFMPGAFRDCYARGGECVSLYNHDESILLGKRSNGMKLTEDERGLSYFIPLDPTDPDHVRVHSKIKRGDVKGSSVIFAARAADQKYTRGPDGAYIREIFKAEFYEIGPTPFPVYSHTTAEARSLSIEELIAAAKAACVDAPDPAEFDLLLMV
jgi:HK97 family phage prohead protease